MWLKFTNAYDIPMALNTDNVTTFFVGKYTSYDNSNEKLVEIVRWNVYACMTYGEDICIASLLTKEGAIDLMDTISEPINYRDGVLKI